MQVRKKIKVYISLLRGDNSRWQGRVSKDGGGSSDTGMEGTCFNLLT